jgi:hypothetical protein
VKNTKILQSGEKYEDFSKWWKIQRFFKVVRNAKISQNGEKCKESSKWSCCNGRPAQVENTKILKWWKIQRFFKVVLL